VVWGACINWETACTAYAISGRVIVKYCKAHTKLLSWERSTSNSPSERERVVHIAEGVLIDLHV